MFKKKLSVGLILLLLLAQGGCQAGGIAKGVVFSQEQKSADGTGNASHFTASVQQEEALEKAEAAFQQYFHMQNIDKSLVFKAALIEDDGVLWMNPYWKLSWLGKDGTKPVYSAEIDAQSGEVVLLRCRKGQVAKTASREDLLAYRDTALAFIDKFALVKDASLSIFDANCFDDGAFVKFRYGTGKFITIHFNKAGDVSGFFYSQPVSYTLQGSDLKIDRSEATKLARASVEQYYGEVDTSGLIDDIQLIEGDHPGEKNWFVYWSNIPTLADRDIGYGAQIDAVSGKVGAVEGRNVDSISKIPVLTPKINEEKLQEIADRFLEQKHLSDYRFETFVKDAEDPNNQFLRYRGKAGSQLHIYMDRTNGKVWFISFFEK